MTRVGLLVLAFCVWTGLAAGVGWKLRDGSARAVLLRTQALQVQGHYDALRSTTQQTAANARSSSTIERQRLARKAQRDQHFDHLQQDITQHEQHTRALGRDRGDADPEFMRIWRAANAGTGEPADRAGTAAGATRAAPAGSG
jgi:hypothetical protein